MKRNAGYRLRRLMPSDKQGRRFSAYWTVPELGGAVVARRPLSNGWQLLVAEQQQLPDWLDAQMASPGIASGLRCWMREPFATRQDLLEAVRVEQERATAPFAAAALAEALS